MPHAVVFAVAALLVVVPTAGAKDSQSVLGGWDLGFPIDPTYTEHSKNVCVIQMGLPFALNGDLQGPFVVSITMKVKKLGEGKCSPENIFEIFMAPANIHGHGSFDGYLDGTEVAFEGNMVAWHDQGQAKGQVVIQHGTDGLHGILHIEGMVGVGGTYSGETHFAP